MEDAFAGGVVVDKASSRRGPGFEVYEQRCTRRMPDATDDPMRYQKEKSQSEEMKMDERGMNDMDT